MVQPTLPGAAATTSFHACLALRRLAEHLVDLTSLLKELGGVWQCKLLGAVVSCIASQQISFDHSIIRTRSDRYWTTWDRPKWLQKHSLPLSMLYRYVHCSTCADCVVYPTFMSNI